MIKQSFFFITIVVMLAGLSSPPVFAQRGGRTQGETLEIKLASQLPRDSAWGRTLERIASEWARVTNNEVRLRILHNGQEGGEAKMLSSLSSNNIQGALLTSFGLARICPAIMTLSVPFYIKDEAELNAVLKEVLPILEDQAKKTEYVIVGWSKAGWVNVFSKEPVLTPGDLRKQKIATSPDSDDLNTAFKTMGFQMVETEMIDMGSKLMSGAIGAVYQNPAAVAAYQLHQILRNMMSTPLAPAMGALVVNQVTWNKISPSRQQELMRVTRLIATEFDAAMAQTMADAVSTMSRRGLKVNQLSPAQEELWYNDVQRAVPSLLGTTFDPDLYQKIGDILTAYRNGR